MSQAGGNSSSGGGGGSGITTINGDISFVTGSTVTITSDFAGGGAGGTVLFEGDGAQTLTLVVTDANFNTGVGTSAVGQAIDAMTPGVGNSGFGVAAGSLISTGSYNLCGGFGAGGIYTTESGNITFGCLGVAADDHVTRIGYIQPGGGIASSQTKCFIDGITAVNSSTLTAPLPVFVDSSTGQLAAGAGGSGTAQTVGATTADIITIPLGATPATYTFSARASGFQSAGPSGAGYIITGAVRTNGTTATLLGTPTQDVYEEAALVGADCDLVVSANDAIIRATGVTALTIDWASDLTYTKVT